MPRVAKIVSVGAARVIVRWLTMLLLPAAPAADHPIHAGRHEDAATAEDGRRIWMATEHVKP